MTKEINQDRAYSVVLDNTAISDGAKITYLHLLLAVPDGRFCTQTQKDIAHRRGKSISAIKEHLRQLRRSSLILVERKNGGNIYRITDPKSACNQDRVESDSSVGTENEPSTGCFHTLRQKSDSQGFENRSLGNVSTLHHDENDSDLIAPSAPTLPAFPASSKRGGGVSVSAASRREQIRSIDTRTNWARAMRNIALQISEAEGEQESAPRSLGPLFDDTMEIRSFTDSLSSGLDKPILQRLLREGVEVRIAIDICCQCPKELILGCLARFDLNRWRAEKNPAGYLVTMIRRDQEEWNKLAAEGRSTDMAIGRYCVSDRSDQPDDEDAPEAQKKKKQKKQRKRKVLANSWRNKPIEDWTSMDHAFHLWTLLMARWPDIHVRKPTVKGASQIENLVQQGEIPHEIVKKTTEWLVENWDEFAQDKDLSGAPTIGILVGFWDSIQGIMSGVAPMGRKGGNESNRYTSRRSDYKPDTGPNRNVFGG